MDWRDALSAWGLQPLSFDSSAHSFHIR
jgi:hypothetical protein